MARVREPTIMDLCIIIIIFFEMRDIFVCSESFELRKTERKTSEINSMWPMLARVQSAYFICLGKNCHNSIKRCLSAKKILFCHLS